MKTGGNKATKVLSLQGAGGQYLWVIAEYDLVVSFTEENYSTPIVGPWIFKNLILPSLE